MMSRSCSSQRRLSIAPYHSERDFEMSFNVYIKLSVALIVSEIY